jgi:hypothetical protein
VFAPDKEHIHHRLDSAERNPRNVAAVLYLANCLLVLTGIASLLVNEFAQGMFVLLFVSAAVLFVRYIARVELAESRVVLRYGFSQSMQVVRHTILFALLEAGLLSVSLYGAIWATYVWYVPPETFFVLWGKEFVQWVLLIVLGTTALRMYYYISNKYISSVRMLATDFIFIAVLLAVICSVVTAGFTVERIQASYYFSMAVIILVSLRLARFAYLRRF